MRDVALDIGSCFTKVHFVGDTPSERVFETPVDVQKLKQCFDATLTSVALDSFLRWLSCALGLPGSCRKVELLVSPGDSPLFTQYVLRWFSRCVSLGGITRAVDAPSWILDAHGVTNGCVVDIGNQATRIVPVLFSIPIVEAITFGNGMREFSSQTTVGENFSSSTTSLLLLLSDDLIMEMSQYIIALLEESLFLCNAYTQRPFICDVFLLTGGGVEMKGLVKTIQFSIKKVWANSRLLVATTGDSPSFWNSDPDS